MERNMWELELKKDEMSEQKMTKRMAFKAQVERGWHTIYEKATWIRAWASEATIHGEPANEDYLCEGEAATVMEKEISYLRAYED